MLENVISIALLIYRRMEQFRQPVETPWPGRAEEGTE